METLGPTEIINPVLDPDQHTETFGNTDFESWDLYRDGVTQSIISTFMTCPQKHWLKNIQMLERGYSKDAMHVGTIFHGALDFVYTTHRNTIEEGKDGIVARNALALCEDWLSLSERSELEELEESGRATPQLLEGISQNYGIATSMLMHYWPQWPKDFTEKNWVVLEEEFDIPFTLLSGNIIRLRGKMDGAFRAKSLRGERIWLFETKTKSRIEDETISEKLSFDLQVGMYMLMMKDRVGEQPVGVLYNLVKRPALRRGKNETIADYVARCEHDIQQRPRDYYIRYEAHVAKEAYEQWLKEFYIILDMLERHFLGEFNYRNSTACTMYGPCEYLRYCGPGDTTMFQRRERVFPELSQPANLIEIT